jgi:hypothetical protein
MGMRILEMMHWRNICGIKIFFEYRQTPAGLTGLS